MVYVALIQFALFRATWEYSNNYNDNLLARDNNYNDNALAGDHHDNKKTNHPKCPHWIV